MNKTPFFLKYATPQRKSNDDADRVPTILNFESARLSARLPFNAVDVNSRREESSQPIKNKEVARILKIFRGSDVVDEPNVSTSRANSETTFALRIFRGDEERPRLRVFTG